MKILGKKSLVVALLNAAFMPTDAQTSCVHETLKELGAMEFSRMLNNRSIDFKYGEFTIFAPSDEMLRNEALILKSNGHTDQTIDDIVLFHVSAEKIKGNITDLSHCGESLLMLNEELDVDQETSITDCNDGKIYQVGPGNIAPRSMPEVVGNPVTTCHGIVYTLQGSLMLPTLPNVTLPPTQVPAPTIAPNRQSPPTTPISTEAPASAPTSPPEPIAPASGSKMLLSNKKSFAFSAAAGLVIGFL